MCPHHPDIDGECDCRKPGLVMYRMAVDVHRLDAAHSLFAGDRMRDVIPAVAFGGLGIMLDVESTPAEDRAQAGDQSIPMERSLGDAVERFFRTLPAQSH
jgi:histidinol phosphatase-like enzyme